MIFFLRPDTHNSHSKLLFYYPYGRGTTFRILF